MSEAADTSPFHAGERAVQTRLGVAGRAEMIGRRVIRDHLTQQHREFFAALPFVFLGAIDDRGRPWASPLFGRPGFMSSPSERRLHLRAPLLAGDPLTDALRPGANVGLLGIDYATRRRNRVSARLRSATDGFELDVVQTFGNCPKYIQARAAAVPPDLDEPLAAPAVTTVSALTARDQDLVTGADNFMIASHHAGVADSASAGADVSHRGGMPGFVQFTDTGTLEFPDYPGNKLFNTLGNIASDGRAGLTFTDFERGDLLYLSGEAEIIWNPTPDAQRLIRFHPESGTRLARAVPLTWEFLGYAPQFAAELSRGS